MCVRACVRACVLACARAAVVSTTSPRRVLVPDSVTGSTPGATGKQNDPLVALAKGGRLARPDAPGGGGSRSGAVASHARTCATGSRAAMPATSVLDHQVASNLMVFQKARRWHWQAHAHEQQRKWLALQRSTLTARIAGRAADSAGMCMCMYVKKYMDGWMDGWMDESLAGPPTRPVCACVCM